MRVLGCCCLVPVTLNLLAIGTFNLCIHALKAVRLLKVVRVLYPCMCKVCVAHQQQVITAKIIHSYACSCCCLLTLPACIASVFHTLFTALFKCNTSFVHVVFAYFLIVVCDGSV